MSKIKMGQPIECKIHDRYRSVRLGELARSQAPDRNSLINSVQMAPEISATRKDRKEGECYDRF